MADREWNLQQQVLFRIHTEFPFHPSQRAVVWGTFCTTKVEMKNEFANDFVIFFGEFFVQKKRYDLYHTVNFLLCSLAKPFREFGFGLSLYFWGDVARYSVQGYHQCGQIVAITSNR